MGKDSHTNNTLCCIIYIKTMLIEVSCWVTLLHAFSCGGGTADAEINIPAAENPELLKFLSSSPGVAQNIVFHASADTFLISAFSVLSTFFFLFRNHFQAERFHVLTAKQTFSCGLIFTFRHEFSLLVSACPVLSTSFSPVLFNKSDMYVRGPESQTVFCCDLMTLVLLWYMTLFEAD